MSAPYPGSRDVSKIFLQNSYRVTSAQACREPIWLVAVEEVSPARSSEGWLVLGGSCNPTAGRAPRGEFPDLQTVRVWMMLNPMFDLGFHVGEGRVVEAKTPVSPTRWSTPRLKTDARDDGGASGRGITGIGTASRQALRPLRSGERLFYFTNFTFVRRMPSEPGLSSLIRSLSWSQPTRTAKYSMPVPVSEPAGKSIVAMLMS